MSRIQDELYEMAQDLYDCGLIDKEEMLEHEALHRESLAEEAAEKAATESAENSTGNDLNGFQEITTDYLNLSEEALRKAIDAGALQAARP